MSGLSSRIRTAVRRIRPARPGAPPDLRPDTAFEALLDQRLNDLAAEVADIKGRINGLIFVVVGGLISNLIVRFLG